MATYLYPEAREMAALAPDFTHPETLNDPFLARVFPVTRKNAAKLVWTVGADDQGLQQLRGVDGSPLGVNRLGRTEYSESPGYYGEFETITEKELTERAGSVMGEVAVDVGDLVAEAYSQLRKREVARIRYIAYSLLVEGTFSVSGRESTIVHAGTYAIQTHSGSDWSTVSTATPLADFRAVQQLGSAYGVNFGSNAIAAMNRVTANRMFNNTNASDLAGRKTGGGGTITNVNDTNRVMMGEDLPEILIMDDSYKNDSGTETKFIADDKVVVVGTRKAGDPIGEYRMTRNLNNPGGAPGHYEYIKDYANGINAPKQTPPKIEIHAGHNGGPVLWRPKAIVVMSV